MVVSNDDPLIEDGQFIFDDYELSGPIALPPKPDAAENEPEIITFAEHMPAPIGGMEAIYRHVTYPEIARKAGIEGRVVLQFIVDERGNVVNPIVIRGIGGGCDEAALEAIKNVKFTPGLQRGRPVKVQYQLPIVFRLQ
jgi:protein TonB